MEISKLILKLTWKFRGSAVARIVLKEKSRIGVLVLSYLRLRSSGPNERIDTQITEQNSPGAGPLGMWSVGF